MSKYQEGQFVTFVTSDLLEVYDEWIDNQIQEATPEGKYIFEDFDGEWDESIIDGLAEDQRDED